MDVTWEAPGPGTWELDASHFPPSVSRIVRDVVEVAVHDGLGEGFDLIGAPLKTMDARFVNGRMYRRLVPLIGGDRSGTPPSFVLWAVARLHPTFRRRARQAEQALDERRWLDEERRWEREWKPALIADNSRFGRVEVNALDDEELAAHVEELDAHLRTTSTLHFRLHASDLGPIGLALVRAQEWGIDASALMQALAGSSTSTSDPAVAIGRVRDELRAAGVDPTRHPPATLDEVRAAGPGPAAALDEYLDLYGARLTTGYDLSDLTLSELPEVIVAAIADDREQASGVAERASATGTEALAAIRAGLAADDVAEFDRLIADARLLYGLRDANGPLTFQWPAGLMRLGLLAAAPRLVQRGALADPAHVFDLTAAELAGLLRGASAPSARSVQERFDERQAWCALDAPRVLGEPPSNPPIDVLPGAMATMMRVTVAVTGLLEAGSQQPMAGTGIGSEPYTGTARVVADADEAFDRVEPGDVIVARLTVPTFNAVLALAGAVVTEQGGLLCHTAVIARELGIPAVVGVAGALTSIPDGARVTVDPVTGRVHVQPAAEHAVPT